MAIMKLHIFFNY